MSLTGTAWRVEDALARHYLRTDGAFGSAPLRFIDATSEELASALSTVFSFPVDNPDHARRRFLGSLRPDFIRQALCDGVPFVAPYGVAGPGWFQYLMLTCVIASASPEVSQSENFRERLREELGISTPLMNLTGIPKLWRELQTWCDRKKASGQPYRTIILPDPGHMTQIGYSVRITFPSRRDLGRMDRLFGPMFGSGTASPRAAIAAVRNRLYDQPWSDGFKAAFSDFEEQFSRGHRLLADHPFWLAISRLSHDRRKDRESPTAHVELSTDIEGETVLLLSTDDPRLLGEIGFEHDGSDMEEPHTGEVEIRDLVTILCGESAKSPLGAIAQCAREGAIPFDEADWGCWRATRTPESSKVRLLLDPGVSRGGISGRMDFWFLTDPIDLDLARMVIGRLRTKRSLEDDVSRAALVGGIKVGANYLGRPGLLPCIAANINCTVEIRRVSDASGTLSPGEREGSLFSLNADGHLRGAWTASVAEAGLLAADLTLRFVQNATEHDFSKTAVDSRWEPEPEIDQIESSIDPRPSGMRHAANDAEPATYDLLEAIYAGGGRGWSEPELIALLGGRLRLAGSSVWDALRVLQEGGWLEPCSSSSWRARRWFLRRPCLVSTGQRGRIVLDGAACETVRLRFSASVEQAGGRVETRVMAGGWSAPAITGLVDNHASIAEKTDLPLLSPAVHLPAQAQAVSYRPSAFTDRSRHVASTWAWDRGRFLKGRSDSSEDVRIDRLEHNERRSKDVYRISKEGRSLAMLDSRTAAIAYGHRLAGRALFHFDPVNDRLDRIAQEGFLPQPVGRYLRLRHSIGCALIPRGDGSCGLAYPADQTDVELLTGWLGPIVSGSYHADSPSVNATLGSLVLRRRLGLLGGLAARHARYREG
jgi:hypothetical protein